MYILGRALRTGLKLWGLKLWGLKLWLGRALYILGRAMYRELYILVYTARLH